MTSSFLASFVPYLLFFFIIGIYFYFSRIATTLSVSFERFSNILAELDLKGEPSVLTYHALIIIRFVISTLT